MIDIVVLAGFVYLAVRVVNSAFKNIEELISRKPAEVKSSKRTVKKKESLKKEPVPDWMTKVILEQANQNMDGAKAEPKDSAPLPEIMIRVE